MKKIRQPLVSDYLKLLFLSAIWGSAFLAIEIALEGFSPFLVAFGRISIAGAFLLGVIFYKKLELPKDKKNVSILIFAGVLNNALPFFLISWGQQFINSSTAAIMLSTSPFIALFISHYTTHDEKFNFFKLLSVVLGFLGVFILVGDDIFHQRVEAIYGQLAVLLATFGYISSGVLIRKLKGVHTVVVSTSMFLTATLAMFPFLLTQDFLHVKFFSFSTLAIVFLALIPTAVASLIRVELVKNVGIQFMSQVSYLIPMFTILWAFLFFAEVPKLNALFALLFVMLGLFIRGVKK